MTYSDTQANLVINKLTKSQYETLKASGSLQSNQIYITPETLPSNLGDFNNDVGYVTASAVAASYATKGEVEVVTASVSALASSVSNLNAKLLDKRDYIDLKYPAVAQDGDNRFGISSWSYSFPVHGIGYQGTLTNYTWDGEYGVWSYDAYSPKVRTSDGQNFQFASAQAFDTGWTDSLALSQVYPQAIVSLQIDVAHGQMNCELTPSFTSTTNLVLENQLSAYATTSSLEIVSASVSSLQSSVETLGSSVDAVSSQVSAIASSVSAMASSISAKRDYTDLTYSYSSTTTLSYYDLYYSQSQSWHYNDGVEDITQQWGIQELHVSIPSQLASDFEEYLEAMGMSLPDGYSSFPTQWTLTYVDAMEIGVDMDFNDTGLDPVENPQCAWLPMGEITVDGQTTNWTQYLSDITGEPLLGMYLFKNITQDYEWYNLEPVESLDAKFTTTQFSVKKNVGSQTLTGTAEPTDIGTYFNIPTTPFQMSFTWQATSGSEYTDTVYVTPVMNSSSVVVNDNLALQGSVDALASSVEANASAIQANASAISANTSAIEANASAIQANASAIATNASAISAMASNFNVSGIGCSTIVLSGTYADSTSFAYNFVIQPSA